MRAVTAKQAEVLRIVEESIKARGHAPTQEEIGRTLGVNKTTINEHVRALVKKGRLVRESRGALGLPDSDEVEQLRRELRILARWTAGLITDPQVIHQARQLASKWLADATGQAVRS